jgi:hypothetical protein
MPLLLAGINSLLKLAVASVQLSGIPQPLRLQTKSTVEPSIRLRFSPPAKHLVSPTLRQRVVALLPLQVQLQRSPSMLFTQLSPDRFPLLLRQQASLGVASSAVA